MPRGSDSTDTVREGRSMMRTRMRMRVTVTVTVTRRVVPVPSLTARSSLACVVRGCCQGDEGRTRREGGGECVWTTVGGGGDLEEWPRCAG